MAGETFPYLRGADELVNPQNEPEPGISFDVGIEDSDIDLEGDFELAEPTPEEEIQKFLGLDPQMAIQDRVANSLSFISKYLTRDMGYRDPESFLKGFIGMMNSLGIHSKNPLFVLFNMEEQIKRRQSMGQVQGRINQQRENNSYRMRDDGL